MQTGSSQIDGTMCDVCLIHDPEHVPSLGSVDKDAECGEPGKELVEVERLRAVEVHRLEGRHEGVNFSSRIGLD